MIQPARTSKIPWTLEWIDFDEPAMLGGRCVLPTAIYVFRHGAVPPIGQELVPELDQRKAERLLGRLIADNGYPDKLFVAAADEWDEEGWEAFARDGGFEVSFFEEDEARLPRAVLNARAARDSAAEVIRSRLAAELAKLPEGRGVVLARELAESATKIRSLRKRRATLNRALAMDKKCAAAIVGLGEIELNFGDAEGAFKLFNQFISETKGGLPPDGDPLWWDGVDSRNYLRGLYGRAMALWHKGNLVDALADLEELLKKNPLDHQGARFYIPLLMQLNDLHGEAARWFRKYEKEYAGDFNDAGLLFSWGLSLSKEEEEEASALRYREGMLRNLYIAPQLLDRPEPPDDLWQPNDRCEPGYADDFCRSFATLWERDAAARRFLAECFERFEPDIRAMIDLRERMGAIQDQRYDPLHDERWKKLLDEEKELVERRKGTS